VSFGKERAFWFPFYRLAGQGLSDADIANKLNLTEVKVQGCVAWILQFLKFTDRIELIRYASVWTTI
jgi:DNA-binding NarL/FixJ family response regulator